MKSTQNLTTDKALDQVLIFMPVVLINLIRDYMGQAAQLMMENSELIDEWKQIIKTKRAERSWRDNCSRSISYINTLISVLEAIAQNSPCPLAQGKDCYSNNSGFKKTEKIYWYGPRNGLQPFNFFTGEILCYSDSTEALQDLILTDRNFDWHQDLFFKQIFKVFAPFLSSKTLNETKAFFIAICKLANLASTNFTPLIRTVLRLAAEKQKLDWMKFRPSNNTSKDSEKYKIFMGIAYQNYYSPLFRCKGLSFLPDSENTYNTVLDSKAKQKFDEIVFNHLPQALSKRLLAECERSSKSLSKEQIPAYKDLVKQLTQLTFTHDLSTIQAAFTIIAPLRILELNSGNLKVCLDNLENILKEAKQLLTGETESKLKLK